MSAVDGMAAARTMIGFGTWRAGYCMEAVWQAYKRNGARTSLGAPTAYDGWLESGGKHPDDRNPPPGVPVYFGPKAGSRAGDVVISLGGGQVVATDWPRNGVIGITTIDARQRQIGRPYLGWTDTALNHPISFAATLASVAADAAASAARIQEEDDMLALRIKAGPQTHLCTLSTGVFSHLISSDNPERVKNVVRSDDAWTDIDITELPVYLHRFGCDLSIWDTRDKNGNYVPPNQPHNFVVLDPRTGKATQGGMWSAINQRAAELKTLLAA